MVMYVDTCRHKGEINMCMAEISRSFSEDAWTYRIRRLIRCLFYFILLTYGTFSLTFISSMHAF